MVILVVAWILGKWQAHADIWKISAEFIQTLVGNLHVGYGDHASDRIFIKEISSVRTHHRRSAKIFYFAVTAGGNGYRSSLTTAAFTWTLGVVEESQYPSYR